MASPNTTTMVRCLNPCPPTTWLSLIVVLLNTIDRLVPERMSFESPSGHLHHSRLADAFVNDTCLGFTNNGDLMPQHLIQRLEMVAQIWEKLLHYSGGALNLKKCFWYAQFWTWKDGRPYPLPIRTNNPKLRLTSSSRIKRIPIRHFKLEQAHQTLGVYLNPFSAQIKVLKTKADTFALHLCRSRLTPSLTRMFHQTVYCTYPLPALL